MNFRNLTCSLLISGLALASCEDGTDSQHSPEPVVAQDPVSTTIDTLKIEGQGVWFFSIDGEHELKDSVAEVGFYDSLDDFHYHTQQAQKALTAREIPAELVHHVCYQIALPDTTVFFNRQEMEVPFGVLMYDGTTNWMMESGVMTDIEYMMLASKIMGFEFEIPGVPDEAEVTMAQP
ncbi:hypothetical protein [Pontibacter sp. G13]|uniref:hypothetical protein n=1 Tax=Pontibacter sp. G13 TaxID=3074898 RepID=UPI002889434A|nr:hypothetical protein [Pontibacter sp. G13]WNJ18433.1 hypothetical protein RJD25_26560 [Pontibacter sp. G13]